MPLSENRASAGKRAKRSARDSITTGSRVRSDSASGAARFDGTSSPVREVVSHPLVGGAKVEIDAMVSDQARQIFKVQRSSATYNEYVVKRQLLNPTDGGWFTADAQADEYKAINEQEINDARSHLLDTLDGTMDHVAGRLLFANWTEQVGEIPEGGVWQGRPVYAKARPKAPIVAWPQLLVYDATKNPQTANIKLTGWDIDGDLSSYEMGVYPYLPFATGYALTVVDHGDWNVTASLPVLTPLYDGQSWFYFRVHGPSGGSEWAKVHIWWYTAWGMAA